MQLRSLILSDPIMIFTQIQNPFKACFDLYNSARFFWGPDAKTWKHLINVWHSSLKISQNESWTQHKHNRAKDAEKDSEKSLGT